MTNKTKNSLIVAYVVLLGVSISCNLYQSIRWNKACKLVECYDRVVDTIDDDYFLDVICTTDEWRDLQNCVERNHLGCGCPKDIMPMDKNK
jgi:hypothetical protein